MTIATDLLGDGGELHDVQRLVVGGGALVDVDDHGRSASATEHGLEEFGQLALSERDVAALRSDGYSGRQKKKTQCVKYCSIFGAMRE